MMELTFVELVDKKGSNANLTDTSDVALQVTAMDGSNIDRYTFFR
jgi:hypothetical protein